MPIALSCDCGRAMRIKDELAGRKIRCPACAGVLTVPKPERVADEDDEVVTVMPVESPSEALAPRPSPRQAVKRAETGVRVPSREPVAESPSPFSKPPKPVKRRKVSRSRASRRSGPMLVIHREIVAGVFMMLGATVWFVVGFALGWIYFYPPILFVLGIAAVVRGLTGRGD
jgi:hypothetical protein